MNNYLMKCKKAVALIMSFVLTVSVLATVPNKKVVATTEEVPTEQVVTEETTTHDITTEQEISEESTTQEVMTEELATEESITEEVTIEPEVMEEGIKQERAASTTYTSGDYTYTLDDDGNATITQYTGADAVVSIPNSIDGNIVTVIGNNCFENCKSVTNVVIPDSVAEIGMYAFNNCTNLTQIAIPNTVTDIGHDAFAYTSLTSLELPSSLQTIGYSVIYGVEGVVKVTVPKSTQTMNIHPNEDGPFAGSGVKEVVFEEGITKIPNNALRKCTTLETVTIPDSVTIIGQYAFSKCTNLTQVAIPDTVTDIGHDAFAYTSLTSLELPSSLQTIGYSVIYGVEGVAKVTVPKSTQTMNAHPNEDGPFAGSGVKEVVFEEGITKIPSNALRKCITLETVTIPDSVTIIGQYAFSKCTNLTQVAIPNTVTDIGHDAFAYTSLTSLELPSSLQTIGYSVIYGVEGVAKVTVPKSTQTMNAHPNGDGSFSGSAVKEVVFEEGITKIPNNALRKCTTLEKVTIPNGVTTIGTYAFADCTSLAELTIPNSVISVGNAALRNCTSLFAYCNYFSNGVIACVTEDVSFGPSDEKFTDNENKIIARSQSMFFANTDSLSASGVLPFTIKFAAKNKWKGELSNRKIVTFIPRYTDLVESSIKVDGVLATNYTYNDDTRLLTIPIKNDSVTITYSVSVRSKEKIKSYAYLSANKEGTNTIENIGTLNEDFAGITLNTPDVTGDNTITVSGLASASKSVDIYVDGVKQTSVTSLKTGAYTAEVTISNPVDGYPYTITAKSMDEYENEISVSKNVTYALATPELSSLKLNYYEHETLKELDMTGTQGTRPKVYFMPNTEFTFIAEFENPENLESVYITSTRNNEKKSMEAVYDETTGAYIASGYFDKENTSYVPGEIGVEYTKKSKEVEVSENFDLSPYETILGDTLDSTKISYQTQEENKIEATIDWSGVTGDIGNAIVGASIEYIDKESGTSLEDVKKNLGIGETAMEYLVPGVNDKKYIMNIDLSDKNNVVMLVYDTTDTGLAVADEIISMKLDMTKFGTEGYNSLSDWKDQLSSVSKVADFAYQTYGIYKDYDDLMTEIDQSSVLMDKNVAKERAAELRDDQLVFLAMTTVMPLVVAGATMTGPALIFSCLLASMTAVSGTIFEARKGAIVKGQSFRLNWVVDPSGYIYDMTTNQRLENVTVSAYWIPYDGTDAFWDSKPNNEEYGTLWDATEYEQENPLLSNVDGKYAWDVPEGWWRVKCEKEGYQTTWSDWVTVPPVQTDVNIGMMSLEDINNTIPITKLELDSSKLNLTVGDIKTLTAIISPENATEKTIVWSSSDANIVTVDENGKVTAIAEGTANIIATTVDGTDIKAECAVTVTSKQPSKTTSKRPKVGTKKTLSSGQYKVTKSSSKSREVTFVKPKSSKKTSITIPALIKINGYTYKVTEISSKAFKNNKKLKSVTIGKNVKKIGKEAFYNCKKLKKITIKSTVLKSVGKNAIKNINKKATIKVPKKQLTKYKKLFKSKTGYKKTMKIKK